MERTTITLPKLLVDDLQKIMATGSKTQAVLAAIREEIKRRKRDNIRALAGNISFDSPLTKGRHHDHRLR